MSKKLFGMSRLPLFTEMPTATFCGQQSFYSRINIATTLLLCCVHILLRTFFAWAPHHRQNLELRVVFLLRSLLFSFVILWWSITVEHVKWSARSFEQPWNSFGFIGLIINAEKKWSRRRRGMGEVERDFLSEKGMKFSVFMQLLRNPI